MDGGYIGTIVPIAYSYATRDYMYCHGQLLQISQYTALFALVSNTFGGDARNDFKLPNLSGRTILGVGPTPSGTGTNYLWGSAGGAEVRSLTLGQLPAHTHTATFVPGGGGSATASGTVTLPITGGAVSGLTATSTPSLTATTSGTVKLGTSSNGAGTPTAGAVLGKGGAQATIYAPANPTTDFALGGTQTFTGSVSGTVSTTVSGGTVSGNASGPVSLSVTGSTSGGSVVNSTSGGSQAVNMLPPYLALNFIICVAGLFPARN